MANYRVASCHFVVALDVYDKEILFAFGYSHEKVINLLRKSNRLDIDELVNMITAFPENSYQVVTFVSSFGASVILMPGVPESPKEFGTLSHEVFHCVEAILGYVGVPHAESTSEAYAYPIGYVVQKVFANLNAYY